MATSGVYTLSHTLNELAAEAFDLLQVGAEGETLTGDAISRAKMSANLMLKEWQAQGIHLWTETEGTLFLEVGKSEYNFQTANVANNWFETTTTAATVADALSFSVTSASDIQVNDVIGIIQDDNNLFWTTVCAVSGTTVNVVDQIPLATVSGAFVRNYRVATSTSPELIPVSRMIRVRRKESDDYEIPIVFESRAEYFDLPNKDILGTPIQAYYSRDDLAGETSGTMFLWNSPISSIPVINFTYERKLQILVNANDTVDIPDYAQQAFIYNLAKALIPKFGCSPGRVQFIREEAQILKDDMLSFDAALYPVRMDMRRYG
ncbi:MAG: hypothetical protein V3T88_04140 [Nitrosomonadaceae bacterium]